MASTRRGFDRTIQPTYHRLYKRHRVHLPRTLDTRGSLLISATADVGGEEEGKEAGLAIRGSTNVVMKSGPSMRKEPDLIVTRVVFPCSATPSRHRVKLLYFDAFTVGSRRP
jgi:hypothetical protein